MAADETRDDPPPHPAVPDRFHRSPGSLLGPGGTVHDACAAAGRRVLPSITRDLAQAPTSTRAIGHALALYKALDRALDHAIDPIRGPAHCDREVTGVIAADFNHNRRLVWSSKSVFVLVRAVASALEAESVNLSGANVSHLRDLDLDVLAGAVWNRDTTWPANVREMVEHHSEEIGDGVFQVRWGTERDPHDSVLA
ncbi:MAG: hypothetical protein ACRDNL_12020 [Spirillospora sp.]